MRILHVIHSLRRGGAEQSLATLASQLKSLGHDLHVLALWPPYELEADLEASGVVVHRGDLGGRFDLLKAIGAITRSSQGQDWDIIHAHLRIAELAVGLAPLSGGPKSRVATFHSIPKGSQESFWVQMERRSRGVLLRHRFDHLIAVSRAVAHRHQDLFGVSGVDVIPNPVEVTDGQTGTEGDSPQPPVSEDAFHILSPGRTAPVKGHDVLVKAASQLVEGGLSIEVSLVGGGKGVPRLRKEVAKQGLQDVVSIHDAVPHPALMDWMNRADLIVIPSRREGFGLVAAEAMALGRPVVATDVGGLSEVLDDKRTGLLVPPEEPDALAQAIRVLIGDSALREEMARAGQRSAKKLYSPSVVAEATLDIYRKLPSQT